MDLVKFAKPEYKMNDQIQVKSLALYQTQACPYCAVVRHAINRLELEIEQRDIFVSHANRADLLSGGGKTQVPCLRIESSTGQIEWLYETADIIQYLERHAQIALNVV